MGNKYSYSERLFARPSFLEGVARAFDLGATLQEYNTSPTPEQADDIALASDWMSINEDMATVAAMPQNHIQELARDVR